MSTTAIPETYPGDPDDYYPDVFGSDIVFNGNTDSGGADIFLHRIGTPGETNLTVAGSISDIHARISGSKVVWRGYVSATTVWHAYIYDLDELPAVSRTQLSSAGDLNSWPDIEGNNVVWTEYSGSLSTAELFLYQITSGVSGDKTPLTANNYEDGEPYVSMSGVAWQGKVDDEDWEIFYYDIATETTHQLTDNDYEDMYPRISGETVIWQGRSGLNDTWEIFTISPGESATDMAIGPDGNVYLARGSVVQKVDIATEVATTFFFDPNANVGSIGALAFGGEGDLYALGSSTTGGLEDVMVRIDGETGEFVEVFAANDAAGEWGDITFGPVGDLYVTDRAGKAVLRFGGPGSGAEGELLDDPFADVAPGDPTTILFSPTYDANITAYSSDPAVGVAVDVEAGTIQVLSEATFSGTAEITLVAYDGPDLGDGQARGRARELTFNVHVDTGAIYGSKFEDVNSDGVWDPDGEDDQTGTDDDESALEGWTIYIDTNADGLLDPDGADDTPATADDEPFTVTDANGEYSLSGLAPDTHTVTEVLEAGWNPTYPESGAHTVQISLSSPETGIDFGNHQVVGLTAERNGYGGDPLTGPVAEGETVYFTASVDVAGAGQGSAEQTEWDVFAQSAGVPAEAGVGAEGGSYDFAAGTLGAAFDEPLESASPGLILYVDSSPSGLEPWTGEHFYGGDLQGALAYARANPGTVDEIWVAAGTYKPTGTTNRSISFEMVEGLALYGGFTGTEVLRGERDLVSNRVILSGEVQQDGNETNNSYRVVIGAANAVLNGVTVTGGYAADGAGDEALGGGIHNAGANFAVVRTTVTGNSAVYGGGVYIAAGGSLVLLSSTVSDNTATADGGGLHNAGGTVDLINSTVSGNSAYSGGGIYDADGTLRLTNATVADNDADASGDGGGICATGPGAPLLHNTIVARNTLGESAPDDVAGLLDAESSYSLISDAGSSGGLTGGDRGNVVGPADLTWLGPLADNGGPTETHALLNAAAPAIDSGDNTRVPADAYDLDGDGDTGEVNGSLLWDPVEKVLSFVATGGPLGPDTYTATLASRTDGLKDTLGSLLDGDADLVPGGDFAAIFAVADAGARVVSVPDFARGPGQPVNVPATGAGLPVSIDDADGVEAVDLTLVWDPALLDVSAVDLAAGLPGGWQVVANIDAQAGEAALALFGPTPLPAGPADLAILTATVPADAPYGSAEQVRIESLRLNDGAIEAVADAAVYAAAYLGDATGNGSYSGLDASLIARVAVGPDTGFDAFCVVDPLIVADVTADGTVGSLDATYVARASVGYDQPEIPELPTKQGHAGGGKSGAVLSIPTDAVANQGDVVAIPVTIDDAAGLQSIDHLTISFDTAVLDLADEDVALGDLLAAASLSWSMVTRVDDAAGEVRVTAWTTEPMAGGSGGLFEIAWHVRPDAPVGPTVLDIDSDAGTLNEAHLPASGSDGQIVVNDPPKVVQVYVSSTVWTPEYLAGLGGVGYAVSAGPEQLSPLGWSNIDEIKVTFSEDVSVGLEDLTVTGRNVPQYVPVAFSYDSESHTATWQLDQRVSHEGLMDRVVVAVSANVVDSGNAPLDGDWTDGASDYPSGDGVSGGDFAFAIDVLQADANGDGIVDYLDLGILATNYDLARYGGDFNGDGVVDYIDLGILATNYDQSL